MVKILECCAASDGMTKEEALSLSDDEVDGSGTAKESCDRVVKVPLHIGSELGRGTSGVVSPILDAIDSGRYVVKEVAMKTGSTADSAATAALLHEVRLHRLCSADCGAIVRYVFAYHSQDALLVIMEACDAVLWDFLSGTPTWTHLSAPAAGDTCSLPHLERRRWTSDLCDAVRHCHSLRVLHRDINPWNVFLARQEKRALDAMPSFLVRLGDFGLAVQLPETGASEAGDEEPLSGLECAGAAPLDESALESLYSAPELGGACYGLKADVFSLGMTVFALWISAEVSGEDSIIDAVALAKGAAHVQNDALLELQRSDTMLHSMIFRMLSASSADRPSAAQAWSSICRGENGLAAPAEENSKAVSGEGSTSKKVDVAIGDDAPTPGCDATEQTITPPSGAEKPKQRSWWSRCLASSARVRPDQ
eukprot:gnl/TRDRNA2_/TRDRNA2_87197_c0_seq2.p1 gnl/TRDRNA2_/TRDRNA2_87197_c0~~gnl/TRDRNA2_/TRDRNA2_87197_c0_seq2.p1  ORF type:complete len:423 (-),score=74.90 gnl/TRDRNA2_/TRDRNA2_87197_c0_seq2:46-1314(-)